MAPEHAGHAHASIAPEADRRWLLAALLVIAGFMVAEVVVGIAVGSLALLGDAGHMLTDAAALGLAIAASKLAQRPARGAYTYGFTRIDALSAQANGITLLLLAVGVCVEAVRRLLRPGEVGGTAVIVVAVVGVGVNVLAVAMTSRANRASLNIAGALAHLLNDLWAFVATLLAGVVIVITGWNRADAVASLVVVALMVYSGLRLIRSSGRVFLEAAPTGFDPQRIGSDMASVPGVTEVHDLHVWDLGAHQPALSAHLTVSPAYDCHDVSAKVRRLLAQVHGVRHTTLQADHAGAGASPGGEDCSASHGPGYRPDVADRED